MRWAALIGIGLVAGIVAQDPPVLKSEKDKLSYALGMDLGAQLRRTSVDVDSVLFGRGLKDALSGDKTLMTDQEVRAAISSLQEEFRSKQAAQQGDRLIVAARNNKDGAAFLAANKARAGVVTLPSGLQYTIVKAGTGPKPTLRDLVVCNYRGTLVDGTEFDSSYARHEPLTFPLDGVIRGWSEALQLMPVGSQWQLVVPPDLAYGERGFGQQIGPNATLIFEIELVSIKSK